MRRGWIYILLMVSLMSCSSDDNCMQDLNFSMKAEIYRMVFDMSIEQFVPEKYTVPVSLCGLGRDSLIYDSKNTSTLDIPLQKLDTISSFALTTTVEIDSNLVTLTDTIDFYHINEQEFISLECGCIVKNNIIGISQTTNRIDSVVLVSPEVNMQSGNNIKIYLSQR